MEIIMKVKCSPSPGAGSSPHSTLKIVDHHHQLQQQQHTSYTNAGYKSSPPPPQPTRTYTPNTHPPAAKYPNVNSSSSCNDCSVGYCCNMSTCCVTMPSPHYSQTPPQPIQTRHTSPPTIASPFLASEQQYSNNSSCQSMEEPEFVSIDDEKVKQYLIRLGQQQLQKKQQQQQLDKRPTKEPKITHVFSAPTNANSVKPIVYEIIELDDEDEREKLKQIKEQAEQSLASKKSSSNLNINIANRNTKSLDISLIPKTVDNRSRSSSQDLPLNRQQIRSKTTTTNNNPANHKIIAEIDLLDSDDDDDGNDDNRYMNDDNNAGNVNDEDEDDDDTLPLVAVSCELQCDDDDDDDVIISSSSPPNNGRDISFTNNNNNNYMNNIQQRRPVVMSYSKPSVEDVVIVGRHDDKNSDDSLLVRWEEYEGQRERVFFECFLCGKKVQSSYNLRRHMMIHTGERPFGCDLCDRRFREFSDMKKHRRRHSNEPNYLCMVCHERPPVENDPTRCIHCCTQSKNAVIMAAMKPATEADKAAEENARLKAENAKDLIKPSTSTQITHSQQQQSQQQLQQHPLPTITSVTSFNINAIRNKTPPAIITPPAVISNSSSTSSSNNNNTKTSEETQRLLDNIPAVHRPGYNELGMITRKEFPCPLCNRAFGTRHNLKRHYMIHTGEKPFSCTKCRKPFREYSTLKKHMVTHIRERWYKCIRCPMKFRDFLKYTEHKENHGNDSDVEEQPMSSSATTGMGETNKYPTMQIDGYLDSNDEDSGPEDWLECCECGQRFNEIDSYNEHLKEHDTNTQIFQCYICKQQLNSRTDLDQHIRKQHKLDSTDSMDEDNEEDKETA